MLGVFAAHADPNSLKATAGTGGLQGVRLCWGEPATRQDTVEYCQQRVLYFCVSAGASATEKAGKAYTGTSIQQRIEDTTVLEMGAAGVRVLRRGEDGCHQEKTYSKLHNE